MKIFDKSFDENRRKPRLLGKRMLKKVVWGCLPLPDFVNLQMSQVPYQTVEWERKNLGYISD